MAEATLLELPIAAGASPGVPTAWTTIRQQNATLSIILACSKVAAGSNRVALRPSRLKQSEENGTVAEFATESPSFDIHGLVRINTYLRPRFALEWRRVLGNVALAVPSAGSQRNLRVASLDQTPSDMRPMSHGLVGKPGALYDTGYGVLLESEAEGLALHGRDAALEWGLWMTQYLLLQSRSAFVHAAGVERGGEAILFPSWGGVGKTAIVANLVRKRAFRMLGDDLVIVQSDGSCLGFPKGMVLYPYHRTTFPDVFRDGRGPIAPTWANSGLGRLAQPIKSVLRTVPPLLATARRFNPQSVRVPPEQVFGHGKLADRGRTSVVVWLERVAEGKITFDTPDLDTNLSRILGSTTNEFDHRVVMAANVAAGLDILDASVLLSEWASVLRSGLAGATHLTIRIPIGTPLAEIPDAIARILESRGLL